MSLIIEAFTRIAPLSQEQIENVIQITKEQKIPFVESNHSAHMPHLEEPNKFADVIRTTIDKNPGMRRQYCYYHVELNEIICNKTNNS